MLEPDLQYKFSPRVLLSLQMSIPALRDGLEQQLPIMQTLMQGLPPDDPIRQRVQITEAAVMRQQRAHNPDTALTLRLLSYNKDYAQLFFEQPDCQQNCQAIGKLVGQRSEEVPQAHSVGATFECLLIYMATLRLSRATMLAGAILIQRGVFVEGASLQYAASILRTLVEADDPLAHGQDGMLQGLQNSREPADVAGHLAVRRSFGYRLLPRSDAGEMFFAVHREGGLFFVARGEKPFEVDISLLGDKGSFPDPSLPAELVNYGMDADELQFTDMKHRRRRLRRDPQTGGYAFTKV